MAAKLRVTLAAGTLIGFLGLLAWLQWGDSPRPLGIDPPTARAGERMTNRDCAECHPDAWQQWTRSAHARSWTSSEVQAAFQHFGHDRQCESCHAPQPVAALAPGEAISLREADRESGVNCLTCHALPDNRVAAVRTREDVPCRPLAQGRLAESRMCGACHTAIYEDWTASRYEVTGRSCQDCHMRLPPDGATPEEAPVSHACPGSSNEALIRSGVRMACRREAEQLVVEVTNHATGHNFPGERHHRVLSLEVLMYGDDEAIVLSRREVIKDITPFRGESSAEQIRIDQTFRATFPVAAGATRADVKLLYKRFPWQLDWNALIVHQEELDLATR